MAGPHRRTLLQSPVHPPLLRPIQTMATRIPELHGVVPRLPAQQPGDPLARFRSLETTMTATAGTIELTDLQAMLEGAPQCDHSEHHTDKRSHAGDAVWETTTTCPDCKHTVTGLRCDQWRTYCLTVRGQIICTACGAYELTYDYYRNTHWRKL